MTKKTTRLRSPRGDRGNRRLRYLRMAEFERIPAKTDQGPLIKDMGRLLGERRSP